MHASRRRHDFAAPFEPERSAVTIEDGRISIHIGAPTPYQVSLAEIQCEGDILEKVMHLFECTRVDIATIRSFIHHARRHLERRREATAPLPGASAAEPANN